jgi:hypothetical protein
MISDMMRARIKLVRVALGASALSMALLAGGCTKPVDDDDPRMIATPEQERRAPTQPSVRPPESVAEAKQARAPTTTASKKPVQEKAQPAAAAPVHTVSELMGKRQAEVSALMGSPARIEQRAASTVWVYQGGDCALDVFFFLDMATSDERVLTVAPSADSAAAAAQVPTTSGAQTAASDTASAPGNSDSTAIDACYGKLRRS